MIISSGRISQRSTSQTSITWLTLLAVILLCQSSSQLRAIEPNLVQWKVGKSLQTGVSLARDPSTWLILGTDGQLHYLESAASFRDVRPMVGDFVPDSPLEMRASLMREFGSTFEVIVTKNFLVVQPKGRGNKWPETFESLHQQFTFQLERCNVNVRTGKFKMVAVVLPDRAALHAELDRQNIPSGSIAGIYIANSNRVYTHDNGDAADVLAVLRHEAAHQSAFNSNVHSRLNETPKWLTEGLGMLFESPTIATGRSTTSLSKKSHADALVTLHLRYSDERNSLAADMVRLIGDDSMFGNAKEIRDAYAISWLMMFYFSEKRPAVYAEYLNHTASRPPFVEYTRDQRLHDFQRLTGSSVERFAEDTIKWLPTLAN